MNGGMGTFYFLNRYGFIYQSSEPFLIDHFAYSSINCK